MKKLDLYVSVFIVCAMMAFTKTGCPILYLTGIPCLGCGMTRACLCLLHFDFAGAYYYHPLCCLMPVVFILYLCREKIDKAVLTKLQWIFIGLFVLVYVIRLLDSDNMLIKVSISNSLLYRIVYSIPRGGK